MNIHLLEILVSAKYSKIFNEVTAFDEIMSYTKCNLSICAVYIMPNLSICAVSCQIN